VPRFSSIFSQLLQLFPRIEFEQAVKKHRSDYSAKGFTSWGQFVAMLFCQFGRAQSLREIRGGLASCEGKLKHLGVSDSPKRSTLAYANANRPWPLYQTVFEQLLAKCETAAAGRRTRKKFRFKNKLVSLDASVIDLSLSLFNWAQFRRTRARSSSTSSWTMMAACLRLPWSPTARQAISRWHADSGLIVARWKSWTGATSITSGSFS
jgi:hypothetical protein